MKMRPTWTLFIFKNKQIMIKQIKNYEERKNNTIKGEKQWKKVLKNYYQSYVYLH